MNPGKSAGKWEQLRARRPGCAVPRIRRISLEARANPSPLNHLYLV